MPAELMIKNDCPDAVSLCGFSVSVDSVPHGVYAVIRINAMAVLIFAALFQLFADRSYQYHRFLPQ